MEIRHYIADNTHFLTNPVWAARFCRALWRYREKSKFSRALLAAHLGVEEKDVARWETGLGKGSELPNPDQLMAWLEHFGFSFLAYRYDGINLCGYTGNNWDVVTKLYDSDSSRVTSL